METCYLFFYLFVYLINFKSNTSDLIISYFNSAITQQLKNKIKVVHRHCIDFIFVQMSLSLLADNSFQ